MRIGIYDPYLDDRSGGEKYILSLAECVGNTHEVSVMWNSKEDLLEAGERFGINLSKINFAANIFSKNVGFLKRQIESRKFDILIVLSDGSVPLVSSKKLFLHFQQPIPGKKINLKTKLKLKRVSRVFCNSYFTKKFIDDRFGLNSIVIYPPIILHPKKVKKENIILHVGKFRAMGSTSSDFKKQHVMVEVFKKMVRKDLKGWKFVIAVSVSEADKMVFDEFKKKAVGEPIEFLINKTNDELWDIYSRAKIYWHASGFGENVDEHPELAEPFGISTVEAMGAGAVPVVYSAGGQKEIVENNINGFLWNSLEEFEEKTLLLVHENKILENMAKEAKMRAADFAGDRFCEEVKKLVESD